jgi:AraC-like DNA-binding protein
VGGVNSEFESISSLLPSFGFSSEQMGTDDNIAAWRETTATFFDVDELAAGEPLPFRADLRSYAMGSILLGMARASGQRFRRTAATIVRSGVDHIILQLYVKGGYEGVAGEMPIRVEPGDICVLDLAQTFETRARAFENVTLVVPRPMFDTRLLQVEDLHGLVLAGDNALALLLARHLSALLEYAPRMTSDECQAAVEGTVALVSACLRGELERRDADRSVAMNASLFRIRRHIEARLSDPDLCADAIALHFGLSRASLYRLFAPTGGIAEYIRSRRLHRAFFALASTGARGLRISEVARRWQLGTDAHFTRSFKAAYGITPRAAREAALPGVTTRDPAERGIATITRWMHEIAAPQIGDNGDD